MKPKTKLKPVSLESHEAEDEVGVFSQVVNPKLKPAALESHEANDEVIIR